MDSKSSDDDDIDSDMDDEDEFTFEEDDEDEIEDEDEVATSDDGDSDLDVNKDSDDVDRSGINKNAISTEIETASGENWNSFGGWYRDEFTIRYRPTGHADAFIVAWANLTGGLAPKFKDRDPTTFQANFQAMPRQVCVECHTADKAGDNCLTCHNYHLGVYEPLMFNDNGLDLQETK